VYPVSQVLHVVPPVKHAEQPLRGGLHGSELAVHVPLPKVYPFSQSAQTVPPELVQPTHPAIVGLQLFAAQLPEDKV
jgi:hypothetical protein